MAVRPTAVETRRRNRRVSVLDVQCEYAVAARGPLSQGGTSDRRGAKKEVESKAGRRLASWSLIWWGF